MNRMWLGVLASTVGVALALGLFQNCASSYGEKGLALDSFASKNLGPHMPKEIIVKMKSNAANQSFYAWALDNGLTLETEWPQSKMSHWSWTADADVAQMQASLEASALASDMEFDEPNYMFSLPPASVLNASVAMAYAGSMNQTLANVGLVQVRAELAASRPPVTVAVIDSGVDFQHEIFTGSGAAWTNSGEVPGDGLDNDGNGFIDDIHGFNFINRNGNVSDSNGHGTHCAGIVLGTGQDIFQRPLTPAKVRIMGLKFLGANGEGATAGAVNAIYYAVNNGAQVLSNSWGGSSFSQALEEAIAYAYEHDVAFVAAAGNSASNNDVVANYPSSYQIPQMIAVAATSDSDALASFSNYGPASVNIAAPGVAIVSSVPGSNYAAYSGTSMATPFVAGTAALMYYQRSGITSYEVKDLILRSADRISLNGKVAMNRRLNVVDSVAAATSETLTGLKPSYQLSRDSGNFPNKGAGGCGLVVKASKDPGNPPPPYLVLFFLPLLTFFVLRQIPLATR